MPVLHPAIAEQTAGVPDPIAGRRGESTLQVVVSLLRLRLHHASTPEAADALARAIDEIDTVVGAHHQLNAAGAEPILDASAALRALVERMAAATPTNIEAKLGPARIASRHLIPLLLMAHEALVNALGHGFPDGRSGTVALSLEELADGTVRLTVADNGVGLASDTDFPAEGRRGALLLRQLAQQSGIGLTVAGSPGVTVTIDLPSVEAGAQGSST